MKLLIGKSNNATIPKVTVYGSILGHGLEMYDFTLYGALIGLISEAYFTFSNSSFYLALLSLSTGYIARPFGALLIGYMADRYGRKTGLIFTIFCASLATGAIGLCPTYEQIGIIAPVVLVCARLLQGICAGAETSNSSVFLTEHCQKDSTSFGTSMIFFSGGLGCILALLVSLIFLETEYLWGWRIPFIIGMIIGIIILLIRLKINESFIYEKSRYYSQQIKFKDYYNIFAFYNKKIIITIMCGALSGITSTTLIVFSNLFLQKEHGIKIAESLLFSIYGLIAFLFSCFFCSKINSKIIRKKVIRISLIGIIIWSLPYFLLLGQNIFIYSLSAQVILGIFAGAFISTTKSLVIEQFPVYIRCTLVSLGYNFGYAMTSGIYILLSFWLINFTGYNFTPFILLSIFALSMLFIVDKILNEVNNSDIETPHTI